MNRSTQVRTKSLSVSCSRLHEHVADWPIGSVGSADLPECTLHDVNLPIADSMGRASILDFAPEIEANPPGAALLIRNDCPSESRDGSSGW